MVNYCCPPRKFKPTPTEYDGISVLTKGYFGRILCNVWAKSLLTRLGRYNVIILGSVIALSTSHCLSSYTCCCFAPKDQMLPRLRRQIFMWCAFSGFSTYESHTNMRNNVGVSYCVYLPIKSHERLNLFHDSYTYVRLWQRKADFTLSISRGIRRSLRTLRGSEHKA